MHRTSLHRKSTLLLLVAFLAVPWLAAAGPRTSSAEATTATPMAFLGRLWSFLEHLWSEEGCNLDPDGRCVPGTAPDSGTIQGDTGCNIDPSGRCVA